VLWAWKGTDKIEFIKLEGYNNIQVQWNGKTLKEMKNLRILIIENTTFSTGPEHLPNSLRVLDWSCYPSPSLPADFNPKRVELLLMPESCLQIFQPYNVCISFEVIIFNMNFYFKKKKKNTHLTHNLSHCLLICRCLNHCLC